MTAAPALLGGGEAAAAVRLGAPFGDHMVLPAGVPVAIWGTDAPGGDTVRVSIAGQTAAAKSDWAGRWIVQLAPLKAGGPFQMLVEVGGLGPLIPSPAAIPNGGAELNDVLVGEVITASGSSDGPSQATVLGHSTVRSQATVPNGQPGGSVAAAASSALGASLSNAHPYALVRVWRAARDGNGGQWLAVTQDTVPGNSAALFELGRKVRERLGVPVGTVEALPAALPGPAARFTAPH